MQEVASISSGLLYYVYVNENENSEKMLTTQLCTDTWVDWVKKQSEVCERMGVAWNGDDY